MGGGGAGDGSEVELEIAMQAYFKAKLLSFVLLLGWMATSYAQLGTTSFNELLKWAEGGDAQAQLLVANSYDSGRGVRRDGAEAMKWYLRAAEAGHAEAQNSVGSGLQAEKQYAKAMVWYERAAAQDHALATNNLAYLYDIGLGTRRDRQKGFELYSRAADLGWAEAMWNLANMYGAGQVGKPDLVAACTWTVRAQRYAPADHNQLQTQFKRVLPELERTLSADQLAMCRKEGETWAPKLQKKASDPLSYSGEVSKNISP